MPTLQVGDGTKITYEVVGDGAPGFVFVHGWACDRSYFAPQIEHFSKSHRVAALDQRGHGESDRPDGGYSIETFADDVLAVAAAAGIDRPIVVGHSLGGLVALAAAARAGAIAAAVMVDPAPIVIDPAIVPMIEGLAAGLAGDADGAIRAGFVGSMFLPTDDAERRDRIVAGMTGQTPTVATATLRTVLDFDGPTALRAVTVPLLSLGSAAPTNADAVLRECCPTITIGQTVGSGHFNQLEVPEQVNAMIERFLAVNNLVPAPTAPR